MPVLKAHLTQKIHESAIVMDLSDLEQQAGEIVSGARAAAQRLLNEAKANAQRETVRIREEARAAGHKDGMQAGLIEGRQRGQEEAEAATKQQLAELTARWSQTLELLHQHMPAHVADARVDVVKLALAIAERVTRQEALRNRQVTPAVVEEALRLVGGARKVALHINPVEMDLMESHLPDMLAKMRSIASVELKSDETVGQGGCLLRFGSGEVDARLETQVARIAEELAGGEGVP